MVWYFTGVYIINRTLHARLWIWILSSRGQLDISLVRCAHRREISSWPLEDKIHIHARACNILYISCITRLEWNQKHYYDNCRNSRVLIGSFLFSIGGQTHEFIIYAMRQRTRADNLTICYRKNKLMSVFNASVLLLTMNFVITLSK